MLRVLLANETVLYGPGYLAVAYRLSKLFIYIPMIGKKFRYCLGRNGVNSMLETQVHSSDLAYDMARWDNILESDREPAEHQLKM